MVDFSRAEGSKNHRSSFIKTSTNVVEYIGELQSKYAASWEELESIRKERAAIIEDTIQLIKNNKIRLGKQLGRCNNNELNEELLNAINALKGEAKERIQINLIKINNRYEKINKIGEELEKMTEILSNYRVLEADYEDEVVITMPKKDEIKKGTTQPKENNNKKPESKKDSNVVPFESKQKTDTEGLEKVINIHKAKDALIADFDKKIGKKKEKQQTADVKEEPSIRSSYIENEDLRYFTATDLYNTAELAVIREEADYLSSIDEAIEEESKRDLEADTDESILFTINDKLTLKDIAKSVYQSEENWKPLYNYDGNTSKIDEIAYEYGVTVEEVVSTPGYLNNVTLQFPTLLISPEEVLEDSNSRSRAA